MAIKGEFDFILERLRGINGAFLAHLMNQSMYYVKKGKLKSAYNYLWTLTTTMEDGAAMLEPLYRFNPDWAPYPERIEVEVSSKCCLRCLKCEHRYWNEKEENMTFEQFKHILEQFPTLRAISMTGIGHGFENPEYFKMLKYVKDKQIFTQFFDPFLLINEEFAREIVKMNIDKTIMSIDAATPKIYNKLHDGSDFNTVVKNIKRMVEFKKEYKSLFPEITFQYIVQKPNVEEMPKFIELVHEITKDDPSLFKTVQFIRLIPFDENEYLKPTISKEIYEETIQRAKELKGFRLTFCNVPDDEIKRPIKECTSWRVPFILVSGDYYPCCALTENNARAKIREQVQWNLYKDDYRDVWFSKDFHELKWKIHKGLIPPICNKYINCAVFETYGPTSKLKKN